MDPKDTPEAKAAAAAAAQQQKPEDDIEIVLRLPLSTVNFTLNTLNKNPLGGDVMSVASLITVITSQAEAQVREWQAKAASNATPRAVPVAKKPRK